MLHIERPLKLTGFCLGVLVLSILMLVGCDTIEKTESATRTPIVSGTTLFADDFSKVPSGWGTWNRKGGLVTYEQGGLRILVNEQNFDLWSVAGKRFEDTLLQVDVSRLAGAADNDFGLICRYQDNSNFYMFLVSSDGYYGVVKLQNDQHSLIGTKQLQYSDQIKPDQTSHHLQAGCVGDTLRLIVDGQELLKVHDSDFPSGDVGVLAGAYSSAGVDLLFDNFKVSQP
jgi:hypothetical protein